MKALYSQIVEEMERIGNLPFTIDEFAELCECIIEGGYDDDEIWQMLEPRIKEQYGEKTWRCLVGYIEGNYDGQNISKMYADLARMPIARIERLLGAGSYGAALDIGHNKVMKWFHKNTPMRPYEKRFYLWCMETNHPFFPHIYRVSDKYIVMEKLDVDTPKCRKYDTFINKIIRSKDVKDFVNGKGRKPKFDPEYDDAWEWHCEVYRCCKKLDLEYPADLFARNLGERLDTREVVWFDI